jgi:hypothetical protein
MPDSLQMRMACKGIKKHDETKTKSAYYEFSFIGIGTSTGAKISLQGGNVDDYHVDDILAVEINTMVVPRKTTLM